MFSPSLLPLFNLYIYIYVSSCPARVRLVHGQYINLIAHYIYIYVFMELVQCTCVPACRALVSACGVVLLVLAAQVWGIGGENVAIPSTLDGPFEPVTVPFDEGLRGHAVDLPSTDPRVVRRAKGFEPEQISLSLSSSYDSIWVSWITGSSSFVLSFFSSLYVCMSFF